MRMVRPGVPEHGATGILHRLMPPEGMASAAARGGQAARPLPGRQAGGQSARVRALWGVPDHHAGRCPLLFCPLPSGCPPGRGKRK